jgi:hypothetical protein
LAISRRPPSSPNFHRRHLYAIEPLQILEALEDRTLEKRSELNVIVRHAEIEETQAGVSLLVWRWLNDTGISKIQTLIGVEKKKAIPMDCSTVKSSR